MGSEGWVCKVGIIYLGEPERYMNQQQISFDHNQSHFLQCSRHATAQPLFTRRLLTSVHLRDYIPRITDNYHHLLTILTILLPLNGAHLSLLLDFLFFIPLLYPLLSLVLSLTRFGLGIIPVHVPQPPPGIDNVPHASLELFCFGESTVGLPVPEDFRQKLDLIATPGFSSSSGRRGGDLDDEYTSG